MLSIIKKPDNIYIGLWVLYYLQGTLYASGGIISQMLLLFILLLSFFYFYKATISYQLPKFLKAVTLFLIVFSIYGAVYIIFHGNEVVVGQPAYYFLKNLYMSMLPMYSFYYFAKRGLLTDKWLMVVTIVLLGLFVVEYYRMQQEALMKLQEMGSRREEITNNMGYRFCALIPLVFALRHKIWLQFFMLTVVSLFVVMAMKRGAILISSVGVAYFLYFSMSTASWRRRVMIFVVSFLAIGIASNYIADFVANSDYFQYRIEQTMDGNSSGRDSMYANMFNYFLYKTSVLEFLFGAGAYGTVTVIGNFAHNDWLEIAISQGVLGLLLFVHYFNSIRKDWVQLECHNQQPYAAMIKICLFAMFLTTLFSASYSNLSIATTLTIGYCLAQVNYRISH